MTAPPRLRITGYTRVPQIEMIARIRDVVGFSGGFILDSHMYSNAILSINFEIHGSAVPLLVEALVVSGLLLSRESATDLRRHEDVYRDLRTLISGAIAVNFIHDDPPLRIEVPAVPG